MLTGEFASLQLGLEDYYRFMSSFYNEHSPVGVASVSESYIITVQTAKKTPAPWSLENIGIMKLVAFLYGQPAPILQSSSEGKGFGTDAKLRMVGWYTPGTVHANDAARHLLKFCVDRRLVFDTATLIEIANLNL